MTGLIENLLSLARADGGADPFALVPIHVGTLARQIAVTWKSRLNQAMLDFQVEMSNDDLVILGDADGIQRLLFILLENASKYTPPGGSIKLCVAAEEERVAFSVQDTGVGIAPEHRMRIFDRFYRAPVSGMPVPAGSGLGLSLAKWIAEGHGTEVNVQSEPGRGSCFSFLVKRIEAIAPHSDAHMISRREPVT